MANNAIHFYILSKHSPMKSEKYTAMLSDLIRDFENSFQDCQ